MAFQIMDSSKLTIAHGANMRFHRRMDQLMRNHIVLSSEPLTARRAKVLFRNLFRSIAISVLCGNLVHLVLSCICVQLARFLGFHRCLGFIRRCIAQRPGLVIGFTAKQNYT